MHIPPLLREIPDAPSHLYIEGTLPDPELFTYIAVVGSRKYSSYGKEACEAIIEGLRGHKVAIVSGLALGIDSIAHRAAIRAGLPTIAVPGSGLNRNVLYPRQNVRLADEIVERGGALLSEFEPKFRATLYSFPQRNRIMAGMSKAVLVIEAGERSGTLITARLALDYNRNVFAVPGSIFSQTSRGTHWLLSQGATPINSAEALLAELGLVAEKRIDVDLASLSSVERKVLEIVAAPLSKDELIRQLDIPTHDANALLVMMEIKGLIKESLGEIRIA